MGDIEQFKDLFDNIGIKYDEEERSFRGGSITVVLTVDPDHICDSYAAGLEIVFTEDGKFKEFVTSGE